MESYPERALAYLKGEMNAEEQKAFEEELTRSTALREELERSRQMLDLLEAASEEAIARRVTQQIEQAIQQHASDIHIVPEGREARVFFRIDGQLQEVERLPRDVTVALVDRWKERADCQVNERQLPQEGRIEVRVEEQEFDLRVAFLPTVQGERMTVRIVHKADTLPGLETLGMGPAHLAVLRRLIATPNGLIVAASPVGHGKTTLLYALLLEKQAPGRERANILTVEDPIEFVLSGISQTAVNRRIGLTMATALRILLRSDPDVVLVGAIPDQETAELALQTAVTGHLIFAQLTANSALTGIQHLRDRGVDSFLIAQTLCGVVSQRLARRICPHCITEYLPHPLLLQRMGLSPIEDGPFYHGAGCAECRNGGYKGRIGLFEILEMDDTLCQLIANNAPVETLWQETFGRKGSSLWDDARAKVRQGLLSLEEATRVLFDYPHPFTSAEGSPEARYGIADLMGPTF